MPRGFVVNGPTMVSIRFGDHVSGTPFTHLISPPTALPTFEQLYATIQGQPIGSRYDIYAQISASFFGGQQTTASVASVFEEGRGIGGTLLGQAQFEAWVSLYPGFYEYVSQAFGYQLSPAVYSNLSELGLATDQIFVSPRFHHHPIIVDDFGPETPAEVLVHVSEVRIRMDLIHWDPTTLEMVVSESMGGGFTAANQVGGVPTYTGPTQLSGFVGVPGIPYPLQSGTAYGLPGGGLGGPAAAYGTLGGGLQGVTANYYAAGGLAPGGMPLGRGVPLLSSGNHFVSVNLSSPYLGLPLRFRACFLAEEPFTLPLGTEASLLSLQFRCIPYAPVVSISQTGGSFQVSGNANFYTARAVTTVSGLQSYSDMLNGVPTLWDRQPDV